MLSLFCTGDGLIIHSYKYLVNLVFNYQSKRRQQIQTTIQISKYKSDACLTFYTPFPSLLVITYDSNNTVSMCSWNTFVIVPLTAHCLIATISYHRGLLSLFLYTIQGIYIITLSKLLLYWLCAYK